MKSESYRDEFSVSDYPRAFADASSRIIRAKRIVNGPGLGAASVLKFAPIFSLHLNKGCPDEVTVAKTACGFPSPVFAIPSVVWLSVGGAGSSEASWPVSV